MREQIIKSINDNKIIAIIRDVDSSKLIDMVTALYKAGIKLCELTFDSTGTKPDLDVAQDIKMISSAFKGKMFVGAGTVLTTNQIKLAKESGAVFLVSPNTDEEIIRETKKEGLVSISGAFTATECINAHNFGADFVKLFPSESLGISYIKALKAPLSHIKLLAFGGVNADNLKSYLSAGASAVGIGSGIVRKDLIDKGDFSALEEAARQYTSKLQ